MPCDSFTTAASCRSGGIIGGWAVGGEVIHKHLWDDFRHLSWFWDIRSIMSLQDFLFPEGIAYPVGGAREAMIEMHYDNPGMVEGKNVVPCDILY